MRRHTLFARFLSFLLGAFLVVGVATAQPYGGDDPTGSDPMYERLTAILDSLAGGTFSGNPCDFSAEQRQAFDRIAREEFGFEFGWSNINCDSTGSWEEPSNETQERLTAILDSLAGGTFSGNPCDFSAEQRQAFDRIAREEFGFEFGWSNINCDSTGSWEEPSDETKERLTAILDSLAGGTFNGNPCDLTLEQRQAFDRIAREEFGFEFGWSTLPCDSISIGDPWTDTCAQRITAILDSISGGFFNGDPCSLTTEQRRGFDSIAQAEFGFNFGWGEINCDGGGWSDPGKDRIMEIIDSVAGTSFTGNPCDLTPEQRQEIDQLIQQELGMDLGWRHLICDSLYTPIDPLPIDDRMIAIIDSIAGGNFSGNPCDLTLEQRQAIDSAVQTEFGFNLGWGDIDCSDIGWGDPAKDRIMEIIDSVAGTSFTGNPCDLTLEQRQEIDRRIQEELGFDIGWGIINCDDIDWGGGDTIIVDDPYTDLTPEQLMGICQILEEVAGTDFSGDICDLTLEQRQEIDRRMLEEVGLTFGLADFPCGGIITDDPNGDNSGKVQQTQQAIARMATINRQESIEGVTLHPNPARTSVTVTFNMNRTAEAEVVVVNGLGERVMTQTMGTLANGQHTTSLDVSEVGTGAYFVKVQLNGRTIQTTPLRITR